MKGILNLNNGFGAMLNKFGQCILLSMYWVVFSLPIFTWGAAGCALYSTGRKLLENEEGKLFQTWKSSFKQNFKQGAAVGSLALLVLLVAIYSGLLMLRMGVFSDTLGSIAGIVYLLVVFVGAVWLHYIIAYIARFEDKLMTVLRNTVYMALMHFKTTVRLAIQLAIVCAMFYFVSLIPYFPLIVLLLPSAYSLLTVRPLERVFEQYMPKEETEGGQETPASEEAVAE